MTITWELVKNADSRIPSDNSDEYSHGPCPEKDCFSFFYMENYNLLILFRLYKIITLFSHPF